MSNTTSWSITDGVAQLSRESWTARVNPLNPGAGLCFEADESPGTGTWKVFNVRPIPEHAQQAEEVYVRQSDLIARFDQAQSDAFAFQLQYRALDTKSDLPIIAAVELWASVQTDDLDSQPVLRVACSSPAGESWEARTEEQLEVHSSQLVVDTNRTAALICRCDDTTALWLIAPEDQQHAQLLSSPFEQEQCVELFGHFMEKGVIRRARMRFFLFRDELSPGMVRTLMDEFAASPLPLTA